MEVAFQLKVGGMRTSTYVTDNKICKKCYASTSHTHNNTSGNIQNYLCNSCYSSRHTVTLSNGTIINDGVDSASGTIWKSRTDSVAAAKVTHVSVTVEGTATSKPM